jgi:hypothetical protein
MDTRALLSRLRQILSDALIACSGSGETPVTCLIAEQAKAVGTQLLQRAISHQPSAVRHPCATAAAPPDG